MDYQFHTVEPRRVHKDHPLLTFCKGELKREAKAVRSFVLTQAFFIYHLLQQEDLRHSYMVSHGQMNFLGSYRRFMEEIEIISDMCGGEGMFDYYAIPVVWFNTGNPGWFVYTSHVPDAFSPPNWTLTHTNIKEKDHLSHAAETVRDLPTALWAIENYGITVPASLSSDGVAVLVSRIPPGRIEKAIPEMEEAVVNSQIKFTDRLKSFTPDE